VREEVIAMLLMRVYCNNASKPNKIDGKEEEEAGAGAHTKGFFCSNKGNYFILLKP
jgi:hypothetical protein